MSTFKLILRSHHHPDTKTRQRQHTKRKLQAISLMNTDAKILNKIFSSVHSLSHIQLFVTPWTEVHQASLSITNFPSLLKLMSVESVMPFNHLIFCHPLFFLSSVFPSFLGYFPMSWLFASGGHSVGASASAGVLPMNIQG